MNKDNSKFSRFKGATWFEWFLEKPIIIGGVGGIGSWFSLLISRLGSHLYVFDMDSFEAHNQSGQLVREQDISKLKTDVAIDIAKEFSNHDLIEGLGRYDETSESNNIMVACFDNMQARKCMFNNWKSFVSKLPEEERRDCIFIDGRLEASQYQILCVQGTKQDQIDKYEKDYLFDDSEVEDADCTFKQTSHMAAAIAAHMVGFLTNFAVNNVEGVEVYNVPFYHEYNLPVNITTNEG